MINLKKPHKGPPPSIGWWPTGAHSLRWWDGETWSWNCMDTDKLSAVKYFSEKKELTISPLIKWFDRPESWPDRSKT